MTDGRFNCAIHGFNCPPGALDCFTMTSNANDDRTLHEHPPDGSSAGLPYIVTIMADALKGIDGNPKWCIRCDAMFFGSTWRYPRAVARINCQECGEACSSEVPLGTVVRAFVRCGDCLARMADPEVPRVGTHAQTAARLRWILREESPIQRDSIEAVIAELERAAASPDHITIEDSPELRAAMEHIRATTTIRLPDDVLSPRGDNSGGTHDR